MRGFMDQATWLVRSATAARCDALIQHDLAAQDDALVQAMRLIGSGRPLWLNFWQIYHGDSPARVVTNVFHSREEAVSDCTPAVWHAERAGSSMMYLRTIFLDPQSGRVIASNLAALVVEQVRA